MTNGRVHVKIYFLCASACCCLFVSTRAFTSSTALYPLALRKLSADSNKLSRNPKSYFKTISSRALLMCSKKQSSLPRDPFSLVSGTNIYLLRAIDQIADFYNPVRRSPICARKSRQAHPLDCCRLCRCCAFVAPRRGFINSHGSILFKRSSIILGHL